MMVEPKEQKLHCSRYHPYAKVAPQGGSAELTTKTDPWLKRLDFYLYICHWPDGLS